MMLKYIMVKIEGKKKNT